MIEVRVYLVPFGHTGPTRGQTTRGQPVEVVNTHHTYLQKSEFHSGKQIYFAHTTNNPKGRVDAVVITIVVSRDSENRGGKTPFRRQGMAWNLYDRHVFVTYLRSALLGPPFTIYFCERSS